MRFHDNGSLYSVSVSADEVRAFAARWPCSGMRGATRGMWFQFDKRNGDLVDINGEREGYDAGAVEALSKDAQTWAAPHVLCANCGDALPVSGYLESRRRPFLKFCATCAGISEALDIGNPRTVAVMLYDDGEGAACSWSGPSMGTITHKAIPPRGRFAAVRYRVRMLDGSMWHGTGPTASGNYMRLRRMK